MSNKELSAEASAISSDLQANLTAANPVADSTIYYKHGEIAGYPKENIDGVKAYDRTFMAGTLDAAHKIGLAAHLADPSVDKLEVTVGGAKGEEFSAVYVAVKKGTIPASGDKPAKDYTSFGGVRGSLKSVTSGKSGDLGIAMTLSAEATEAALAKKK